MKIQAIIKPVERISLQVLTGYQRHVSPLKGYRCASGQLHGDTTCSRFAVDTIQQVGILAATPKILAQLQRCQQAGQALRQQVQPQAAVFCCILPIPL